MKWVVYIRLPGLAARVEEATAGGRPVAVVRDGRLLDVSGAAARRGLAPGLALPAARAICPDAVFRPYREESCLEEARKAWDLYARWTPRVEPDGPAGAFLELLAADVRGEARAILAAVRGTLEVDPRAGAAPARLVARIAACRTGEDDLRVVPPGQVEAFMAPLPLADLWKLDRPWREELVRLGFRTIGDLARFPEEELVRRFGPEGRRLAAWSRGRDDERVRALYPPPRWELQVEREGGEGLASALGRLARGLWERLEAAGQATVELTLEIPPGRSRIRRFARPPASAAALARALAALAAELGEGEEEPALLKATVTATPRGWRQLTLEGSAREGLDRVLERLRHRYGEAIRRGPGPEDRRERLLELFDPFRLRP